MCNFAQHRIHFVPYFILSVIPPFVIVTTFISLSAGPVRARKRASSLVWPEQRAMRLWTPLAAAGIRVAAYLRGVWRWLWWLRCSWWSRWSFWLCWSCWNETAPRRQQSLMFLCNLLYVLKECSNVNVALFLIYEISSTFRLVSRKLLQKPSSSTRLLLFSRKMQAAPNVIKFYGERNGCVSWSHLCDLFSLKTSILFLSCRLWIFFKLF